MNTGRDVSAEARSAKVDHLDDAIDVVAARLTMVTEDVTLASRIADALPDRSRWSLGWLMPRLAITAGLAIAASLVVLRTFDERSTVVQRSFDERSTDVQLAASVAEHRTLVERSSNARRTIVERSSNDRGTIDIPDFERSLEAIAPAASLALASLTPSELRDQGTLALEPLAIADLPLTAENHSQRSVEEQ